MTPACKSLAKYVFVQLCFFSHNTGTCSACTQRQSGMHCNLYTLPVEGCILKCNLCIFLKSFRRATVRVSNFSMLQAVSHLSAHNSLHLPCSWFLLFLLPRVALGHACLEILPNHNNVLSLSHSSASTIYSWCHIAFRILHHEVALPTYNIFYTYITLYKRYRLISISESS